MYAVVRRAHPLEEADEGGAGPRRRGGGAHLPHAEQAEAVWLTGDNVPQRAPMAGHSPTIGLESALDVPICHVESHRRHVRVMTARPSCGVDAKLTGVAGCHTGYSRITGNPVRRIGVTGARSDSVSTSPVRLGVAAGLAWRWREAFRLADAPPGAPARCAGGTVVEQDTGSTVAPVRPGNPLRAPASARIHALMNGWSRCPVEPDDDRSRGSRPVAMFGCLLVAAALTGGCTVSGDRPGGALESGHDTAEVPAPMAATRTVGVAVDGVGGALARNVRASLSLAKEACDAPRWRVERLVERAADEAREGLRALGYYEPTSLAVTLSEDDGCPLATVSVSPGEPVRIATVDMRLEGAGSEDEAFAAHLDTLRPAGGEALNHGVYEEARRSIERYAAEHGYLDGRFATRRFTVDVGARSASVELVYRPGRRYRFGALAIEPTSLDTSLDTSLIERLAAYREGEPYDAGRIVEVSQRLSRSGYFERVDVSPRIDRPTDGTVPVNVSLTPRKRHAFTAGAGITTDTGPRVRLGYENRRATPGGHRWSARSSASLIRRSLDAEYGIPLEDPRTEWLNLSAGVVGERTETSRSDDARLGVSQTKSRWGDWLETRFVSLTYHDFAVGTTRDTTRLLTPGVSLATTRYDDRHRPTDGYRLHAEARGGHEAAGSDVSFLRLSGSAGWVRGVPWDGRLLARAELGALAVNGFDALPPSQRFFAGGDSSVRGYEFASLGPVAAGGTVVGGRLLAVGSIEYEHPIGDRWSGAVFVDAGNAFDAEYHNDGLKVGVGFGVRWQSPIGAVRLDMARPLDGTQRFRVHLRFGPDL